MLLILINAPADVDQTSPLTGDVGATPGIIRRLDTVVVEPKMFRLVLAEVAIPTPAKVNVGLVSVLFVNVSVVALPTSVSVASGNVTTRPAVETASIKVTALAALDELRNRMPLLKSVPSLIVKSPLPFGCKCTPMFVLAPSARTWSGLPTPMPFLISK